MKGRSLSAFHPLKARRILGGTGGGTSGRHERSSFIYLVINIIPRFLGRRMGLIGDITDIQFREAA